MIKKNLKIFILTSIVILLPIIAGVILWDKMPEQMPIHWNISGEADKWCNKAFGVFALPLIMLAIHWIGLSITLADPKNRDNSGKIINIAFWIMFFNMGSIYMPVFERLSVYTLIIWSFISGIYLLKEF